MVKVTFDFKRPHNYSLNRASTTCWALNYEMTGPEGCMEIGTAGFVYREEGHWVAHNQRYQRSDCKTRKEAGEWLGARWREARGIKT